MKLEEFLKLEADDILRIPYVHEFGKHKVEIKPLTVGKMIEINPYLTIIAKDDLKGMREAAQDNNFEDMPELFNKYASPILHIIKAVTGLEDKVLKEMEFRDTYIILMSILTRMGTKSFQMSIITGSVVSRSQGAEIIAAQNYLTQSMS
jgi:hypothetical protein